MNLIKTILAIIIVFTSLPIGLSSFSFLANIDYDYVEINDELAINQLREIMLIVYDLKINDEQLSFVYKNKEFKLSLVNNKLILQPGTQIFLMNVDYLYFYVEDELLYLVYERNDKKYEKVLCKKEGFYVNDYANCVFDSSDDCDNQN